VRARDALLSAYERLRAGAIAAPGSSGGKRVLESQAGFELTIERAAVDERLSAHGAVVAVVLRARWESDGAWRERELTTLVGGAP
jgi:hypothetical protein